MRKRFLTFIMSVLMITAVGCGNSDAEEMVIRDRVAVAAAMVENFPLQGEFLELSSDTIENFYDIDTSLLTSYSVYISSSFIAEEIAVFEIVDGVDIQQILRSRVDNLKESFLDYLPEEYKVVEDNAKIVQKDNLICLIIGDDGSALDAFNKE